MGYGISVAAFFWYQKIKMQQISSEAKAALVTGVTNGSSGGGGMEKEGGEGLPRYHAVPTTEDGLGDGKAQK